MAMNCALLAVNIAKSMVPKASSPKDSGAMPKTKFPMMVHGLVLRAKMGARLVPEAHASVRQAFPGGLGTVP